MFIKRNTRPGKTSTYEMFLSFKKKLTSRRDTVSVVKLLSLDKTRFFAGHCPMPGVNIQIC